MQKKTGYAHELALLSLLIPALLGACKQPTAASPQTAAPPVESRCSENSRLQASLLGGIETGIDWSHYEMNCENMLRPDGEGVRLRFSGDVANERLAIIVAIPGLVRGGVGKELPSNVTITVEGSGRFFSTPGLDSCWTDISEQKRLSDDVERYTLTGTLYCVTALGELNGNAAVSVSELSFTSVVDWSTN